MKISNLTSNELYIDLANKRYQLGANTDIAITLGKAGTLDISVTPVKGCYCYLDKGGLTRENGLLAHWFGKINWILYFHSDIALKYAANNSLRLCVSNDSIINISENEIKLMDDGQEFLDRKAYLKLLMFDFENCECLENCANLLPTSKMKRKHHFLCHMVDWYSWAPLAIVLLFSFLFPVLLLFTFWMVIPIILYLFVGVSKDKKKFDEKTEMAKKIIEEQKRISVI